MADTTQQQTLSIRISEDQRKRLERARDMEMARTGQTVSVSEVAKRLLESGREDRLEVMHLLSAPTATLAHIRRKGEAGYVLSRPEWTVVTHFVREGLEAFSSATPNSLSPDSVVAVIDAFCGLLDERPPPADSARDATYVENLRPEAATEAHSGQLTNGDLQRVISHARHNVLAGNGNRLLLIGRNLCAFLEDEPSVCATAIDRVLRTYWGPLWRVAARGHFARTHAPVRDSESAATHVAPPIAPITDGRHTLTVSLGGSAELAFLLSFPGPRAVQYPIVGYPRLSEFRAMLAALGRGSGSPRRWDGRFFIGDSVIREDANEVWFRGTDNGISVGFLLAEWEDVRSLSERAWAVPDVAVASRMLARDYGEL